MGVLKADEVLVSGVRFCGVREGGVLIGELEREAHSGAPQAVSSPTFTPSLSSVPGANESSRLSYVEELKRALQEVGFFEVHAVIANAGG